MAWALVHEVVAHKVELELKLASMYGGPRSKTLSTYICLKDGGTLCQGRSLHFPGSIYKLTLEFLQTSSTLITKFSSSIRFSSFTLLHQTYTLELELMRLSQTIDLNVIASCLCVIADDKESEQLHNMHKMMEVHLKVSPILSSLTF